MNKLWPSQSRRPAAAARAARRALHLPPGGSRSANRPPSRTQRVQACECVLRCRQEPAPAGPLPRAPPAAGKGDELPGQPAQDIVFVVRQKPHPTFTREGDDLVTQMRIPLRWAAPGCARIARRPRHPSVCSARRAQSCPERRRALPPPTPRPRPRSKALGGGSVDVHTLDSQPRILRVPLREVVRPGYERVVAGEGKLRVLQGMMRDALHLRPVLPSCLGPSAGAPARCVLLLPLRACEQAALWCTARHGSVCMCVCVCVCVGGWGRRTPRLGRPPRAAPGLAPLSPLGAPRLLCCRHAQQQDGGEGQPAHQVGRLAGRGWPAVHTALLWGRPGSRCCRLPQAPACFAYVSGQAACRPACPPTCLPAPPTCPSLLPPGLTSPFRGSS